MNRQLLDRESFKTQVFARSQGKCVFCGQPAIDAHHILDRKLWPDGGYYLDNGAAVCEKCHWACEKTHYSVEEVRSKAGIKKVVLPPGLSKHIVYDKWGNEILSLMVRKPGPLFQDDGVQKILMQAGLLHLFMET